MRKFIAFIFIIFVWILFYFFTSSPKKLNETEIFAKLIYSPIPESVSNIKILYQFRPSLGKGAAIIEFNINKFDFNKILQKYDYSKNEEEDSKILIYKYGSNETFPIVTLNFDKNNNKAKFSYHGFY